jgi:hypothetical protein
MVVTGRPGVAVEQFPPPPTLDFRTGVAGFVGFAAWRASDGAAPDLPAPMVFTSWQDFADSFRAQAGGWQAARWHPDELTWDGVQGFFANGGARCWLAFLDPRNGSPTAALCDGLAALAAIDDVDVVCAPSLMAASDPLALQHQLIASWQSLRADWFLILDAPAPSGDQTSAVTARRLLDLRAGTTNGAQVADPCSRPEDAALYYPWVVIGGDFERAPETAVPRTVIPPSGHIAGVFAGVDQRVGVFKAPANEELDGVLDLAADVDPVAAPIAGANPLLAIPGRGIRVWGAATMAPVTSPFDPGGYINVRRLVITLERWLVQAFPWAVFEANDFRLWVRIQRELTSKLMVLYQGGALQGARPTDAFSIKCDAENNPDDVRASGQLVVELQIAPAFPRQFIQIRVVRDAAGVTVTT